MQRQAMDPWIWADPTAHEPAYAVMRWRAGPLYAGPAETVLAFPPSLVDKASLFLCPRADALRLAINGKVEAVV